MKALFQLSNISPGSFALKASCGNVTKSTPLVLNPQRVSLLIQLNKAVYRPNDLIELRVFALTSRTKPHEVQNSSKIMILDAGNNQVKIWENAAFSNGVFEGVWQLADAETGSWRAVIAVDGEVRQLN